MYKPDRKNRELFSNTDSHVPQGCDGTNWINLGKINPSGGGSGYTGTAAVEGAMIYNTDYQVPQYCDGTNWVVMAGGGGPCGPSAGPINCPNIGDNATTARFMPVILVE